MATTKTIIEDEDGQVWMVVTGDPAWPMVSTLRKAHHSVIVLPRDIIVRQVPVDPVMVEDHMKRLGVAVESTTDPETFNLVSAAYQRAVTLYGCLQGIKGDILKTGEGT